MYDLLQAAVPNIPPEVVRLWLVPFAEGGGGLPNNENRWDIRKSGETLSFWNAARWERVNLDLSTIPYSRSYFDSMQGMREAYLQGVQNQYSNLLGEDGRRRFQSCLTYILQNRRFPQPPILSVNELGEYDITDGNHRFLAYISAESTYSEYLRMPENLKRNFASALQVDAIERPHIVQEVWVAHPDWSLSENAQTRQLLRENGWYFGD